MSQPKPYERWHQLVADRNPAGLEDLIAEDAVFFSPVVHTPQRGRNIVVAYLSAAFGLLAGPSFCYVREIVGVDEAMLEFETVIDGLAINGVDIMKWNEMGRIVEFKVMIRPLKAVNLVHERMAAMLQARHSGG